MTQWAKKNKPNRTYNPNVETYTEDGEGTKQSNGNWQKSVKVNILKCSDNILKSKNFKRLVTITQCDNTHINHPKRCGVLFTASKHKFLSA